VRCSRAQTFDGGGGVIFIRKGTALFDTMLISDTEAAVRVGRGGDVSRADARSGRVFRLSRADARAGGCQRTGCAADAAGMAASAVRSGAAW
jgi:hypothetical protein